MGKVDPGADASLERTVGVGKMLLRILKAIEPIVLRKRSV
jgi:hypothetical protein